MKLFRVSFWPVFFCVFVGASPIVLLAFMDRLLWSSLILRMLLSLCGTGIPISLFTAWIYWQYLPVRVSPEGVTGTSFWGFPKTTGWDDIRAVKPIRILNLRWLRVYPKDGTGANWVALFVKDFKTFKTEVRDAHPSGNLFGYELEKIKP
ncbi:MAG TPA: hypothetical protein VFR02_00955 [bacterium]|nr:hypothetical protein [bacterium]